MTELVHNTGFNLKRALHSTIGQVKRNVFLYILILPALIWTFIFVYLPIRGLKIAFLEYDILMGYDSPWVGLANIRRIFQVPDLFNAIINTFRTSVLALIFSTVTAILFAILLNELKVGLYKRVVQSFSYLPFFISWISIIGIVRVFYSEYGPLNNMLVSLFGPETERTMLLAVQSFFLPNVIMLTLWRNTGWNSVIYIAAITAIDPQQYEAAYIDGAGRLKQIWHITLPGMLPQIIILLIINSGYIFSDNFELIYGLQNAYINYDVISTLIYKYGLQNGDYSVATAFSFMQGVATLILMCTTNLISRKLSEISLW